MNKSGNLTKIGIFPLAMLITGSIDSIRNLPTTAKFGSDLIFFFVLAALCFLIPIALIAAELASDSVESSGVYEWSREAFGDDVGLLTIWLQWINTVFWYPTILSFIAGTLAYLIAPGLANDKLYLVTVILLVFWGLTIINLRGIKTSANFASVCTVVGMLIPMVFIISLGLLWLIQGNPMQVSITYDSLIPDLHHSQSWVSLTAMITAFLGMELSAVHVRNIENPNRTFPRALLISVLIILATMIMGSLAIAFVLPQNQIDLVDGIMQAYQGFFTVYHITWLLPILGVMILIGSFGGMINWIISPAKGILQAAENGTLPSFFAKKNDRGIAINILFIQAIVVTLICGMLTLMPSINGFYWLLTDLSTELYLFMYIIFFLAAMKLGYKMQARGIKFRFLKNNFWMNAVASLGLMGSLIAIYVGFIPPDNINVGSALNYLIIFTIGLVSLLLPLGIYYLYRTYYGSLRFAK